MDPISIAETFCYYVPPSKYIGIPIWKLSKISYSKIGRLRSRSIRKWNSSSTLALFTSGLPRLLVWKGVFGFADETWNKPHQ